MYKRRAKPTFQEWLGSRECAAARQAYVDTVARYGHAGMQTQFEAAYAFMLSRRVELLNDPSFAGAQP